MRYLGIDYGTKKTGLAFSDDSGSMAFPYKIVPSESLVDTLVSLRSQEHFDEIVMGHSKAGTGADNPVMKEVYVLKKDLEQLFSIPVHFENEFGTSAQIHRMHDMLAGIRPDTERKVKKDTRPVDDRAAALILQRFLDKM
ncbi:pre-16S rRNA-processing nuclease YqgF [Candidatus Nomurabacteria bacterium]|nr:pre-16S rRNA-processing nuclease YqgF [Candidatus Nomurabacteria bacterium]